MQKAKLKRDFDELKKGQIVALYIDDPKDDEPTIVCYKNGCLAFKKIKRKYLEPIKTEVSHA